MRRLLIPLSLLFLFGFAYSPLLRAGFLARDHRALALEGARASLVLGPGGEEVVVGDPPPPLARLSLRLSRAAWGYPEKGAGDPAAFAYRFENLVLLVLAAVGTGLFARRMLLPWLGSDAARGSGWATGLLFAFHPLAPLGVAEVAARGELLGMALAAWSGAFFLHGRQDRRPGYTALALLLTLGASLSSPIFLAWPLLLAAAELVSTHRYRPTRVRLRTAATTLVIFGLVGSADLFLFGGERQVAALASLGSFDSERDAARVLVRIVEKLGLLVLPANPAAVRFAGIALSGAVFLLAVHPAFTAARSAPRLWGWMLCSWFLVLVLTLAFDGARSITPTELNEAHALLPALAVMAFALGTASSAVSGFRRVGIPCVVAIGYASLAHGNGHPFRGAARHAAVVRAEVLETQELHGKDARILVVDPPPPSRGIEPVGDAVAWLCASFPAAGGVASLPPVHALTSQAFLALAREPEFQELLRGTLVVTYPSGDGQPWFVREQKLLTPDPPTTPPRTWRGDLRSPDLDLATLEIQTLTLDVPNDTDVSTLEAVSWKPRGGSNRENVLEGVWIPGEAATVGVFDLGDSLRWRLDGRVRRIWFDGGMARVLRAEALPRLPDLGPLVPRVDGEDWVFEDPRPPFDTGSRGTYVVGLLDLARLEYEEIDARRGTGKTWIVPEAAARVAHAVGRYGGPVAWYLDHRVEGKTVARSRGRRVGRDGSTEE